MSFTSLNKFHQKEEAQFVRSDGAAESSSPLDQNQG